VGEDIQVPGLRTEVKRVIWEETLRRLGGDIQARGRRHSGSWT